MKKLLILLWSLAFSITLAYAGSGLDSPHNETNTITCSDCHQIDLTTFKVSKPQDDSVCLQCHVNATGGGYSKNNAPKVATHSSATTNTKYGTWAVLCMDCHVVHTQQQRATYGTLTYLGTGTITSVTDNGNGTTAFGYSSFVEQRPGWADFTKWGAKSGNQRGLIFYPNTTNASVNFEILSATADTITTKGSISVYAANSVTPGNIFALTFGQNIASSIQYPTTTNPAGRSVRFFDKTGTNSFAFDESGTHIDPTPDGVCQVCHDQTTHWRRDGTLAAIGVHAGQNGARCTMCHQHADGFSAAGACNACHGYPPVDTTIGGPNGLVANENGTGATSAGAHPKHATSAGMNYPCETCHAGGMPDSPVYDKLVQIGFSLPNGSKAGTYDGRTTLANGYQYAAGNAGTQITQGGTQSCSIACHGDSKPSWNGKNTTTDCTFCHGGNAASVAPIATGTHSSHMNNTAFLGTNYVCAQCHNATVSPGSDRAITGTVHANGVKDVVFMLGGAYDLGAKTCSTVYCHSNGKGTYTTVPSWGSGTKLGCNGCHGTSSTTGAPDYANAGPGQQLANSHAKHTKAGSSSCDACHTNTTTTGTSINAGSLHTNQKIDVTFNQAKAGVAAYDPNTKTCSNIKCHFNGTAQWGDSLNCNSCHGFAPQTFAHTAHIQDATLLTQGYGSTEVKSTAGSYSFGCGNCHPVDPALHANGVTDVNLNPADGGALKSKNSATAGRTGTGATTVCSQIYCHSNGASGVNSSIATAVSPQWGGTFGANKCGSCHGNPPQYPSAGAGAAGANSHYNAAGFMGKEGGHMLTIHADNIYNKVAGVGRLTTGTTLDSSHGNPNVATTIVCNTCHYGIVSNQVDTYSMYGTSSSFVCATCHTSATPTKLQVGSIADKSQHVSGSARVSFAPIIMNSKAQLRDASLPAVWKRNGAYGTSGSYDSSAAALNTGTFIQGSKTCTVVCHNNNPVQWGDTNVTCYTCHSSL